MKHLLAIWVFLLMYTGFIWAEFNPMPAARIHVRYVNGVYYRYTSNLTRVMELNFTFGFNHTDGKAALSSGLTRIASVYGTGGQDAFAITRFTGPGNGSSDGLPVPIFTLDDLLAGQVLVTNNISGFNSLPSRSPGAAAAFETAVKVHGRSVLGFHGSGDGRRGWEFYSEALHPLVYAESGIQSPAPVYINSVETRHIVLEDILMTGTQMEVPMGMDSQGMPAMKTAIIRPMKNEWYRNSRDILSDTAYKALTTCLLRYDSRGLGTGDFPSQFKYAGGNAFSFILKVGNGKAAYLPPGHDNVEIKYGSTSFDGGTGDFERYFAQLLFFLAGYKSEPCGTMADCSGLPIVDSLDRFTGREFGTSGISIDQGKATFNIVGNLPYEARLVDLRGRTVATRTGRESGGFDLSGMGEGVYFLRVRNGNSPFLVQRCSVRLNP